MFDHDLAEALEKGAQGPNAKFTYSCDGHSEEGLVCSCGGVPCAELQLEPALQAPQCPPDRCSSATLAFPAFNYLSSGGYSEWFGFTRAARMKTQLPRGAACAPATTRHLPPCITAFPASPLSAAFLAVADEAFGRQVPFSFLDKVKEEWFEKWVEKVRQGCPASSAAMRRQRCRRSLGRRPGHTRLACAARGSAPAADPPQVLDARARPPAS